nr:hypothetical protein [Brucella intermedia]
MISIFIILIVAIGLTATLAYTIHSTIKTGETQLAIQKTQAQMLSIAHALQRDLKRRDGRLLVPVDVDESGKVQHTLPMVSAFKRTAYNAPFVYCPVGGEQSATGEFKTVDLDGRAYVVAGSSGNPIDAELREKGVAAYVLARAPNSEGDLTCADGLLRGESEEGIIISADGGFGAVIMDTTPTKMAVSFKVHDNQSFIAALAQIDTLAMINATIQLEEDAKVSFDLLNQALSSLDGRKLSFEGVGEPRSISTSGNGIIEVTGGVKLWGVIFDVGNTLKALPGSNVSVSKSAIGGLDIAGGAVDIDGNTVVISNRSSAAFQIAGGRLFVSGMPDIRLPANAEIVSVSGGGRIEGEQTNIWFNVSRDGGGSLSVETAVRPAQSSCIQNGDGSTSCEALCPGTSSVVTGTCGSQNKHPLSHMFGVGEGKFRCDWSLPAGPVSPSISAKCL